MQVEVKLDTSCTETKIIIITNKMSDEIDSLIASLSETAPQVIAGFNEDILRIIEPQELVRIYSSNGKVFAVTDTDELMLRLRLYEVEARLEHDNFVRISNSEIINLKKVKHFDLSFAGTICVSMKNGDKSFVSRRYVSKIKKILGV